MRNARISVARCPSGSSSAPPTPSPADHGLHEPAPHAAPAEPRIHPHGHEVHAAGPPLLVVLETGREADEPAGVPVRDGHEGHARAVTAVRGPVPPLALRAVAL